VRFDGVALALATAVLPVRPVDLDYPDSRRGDVRGRARAVTAGPLRSRPGTPSRSPSASPVTAHTRSAWRGTPTLPAAPRSRPGQRPRAYRRGCPLCRDGACLYDRQRHPFLWLRDGTHPLADGLRKPGLSHRPGRPETAAPVGATRTWARPTSRFQGQPGRRQPIRRSGRTQVTDPTPAAS
jgi:hypothetical protein